MSGNPSSPKGIRNDRIKAAHNWLDRAEQQYASGQDILAVATLMLAQAEMKLMIETASASSHVTETVSEPIPETKKGLAVSRNVIAAAAMAACLVVGLVLGQFLNQPAPVQPSGDSTPVINLAGEIPDQPVQLPYVQPDEESQADLQSEVLLAEETLIPEEFSTPVIETITPPPAPRPVYSPRPRPEPVTVAEAPVSDIPEPLATFDEASSDTTPQETGVDDTPSGNEISSAEVALRTIQALTERLLLEDAFQAEM